MATYSYVYLESVAKMGTKLGRWNGANVYSMSKEDYLREMPTGSYYVIYDDGNAVVKDGKCYGNLIKGGEVLEFRVVEDYAKPVEPKRRTPQEDGIVSDTNELVLNFNIKNEIFKNIDAEIDAMLNSIKE